MTRKKPVDKMKRRFLGPPPRDIDKLESVILGNQLPLAGDVNVPAGGSVQHRDQVFNHLNMSSSSLGMLRTLMAMNFLR